MVNPRIYRAGFVAVALAVIVFAFSLQDQPGPATSSLVPDVFSGQNAYTTMQDIARRYPHRAPGSAADNQLAAFVARSMRGNGFSVTTHRFSARTAAGERVLKTVIASRAGLSSSTIVVLAHRDASGTGAAAEASGTSVELALANVLSGETLNRSVVLVSSSGSVGAAGAARIAGMLPGPVDAVVVLGDMASTHVREPVVVPWSDGVEVAPPMLRNTLATALHAQTGLSPGGTSLFGQFVHLAFPLTVSEQGPFGTVGEPAALLSRSGERPPNADAPVGVAEITATGRAALQSLNALESAGPVPAPSAYVIFSGQIVSAWTIRLLVLALILPALFATVDAAARARRRRQNLLAAVGRSLIAAVPFLLAVGLAVAARVTGLLGSAPPEPVAAGTVPLHAGGIALLAIAVALIAGLLAALQRYRMLDDGSRPGASLGALLMLSGVTLVLWVRNPFAAALVVPALHAWLWLLGSESRLPRAAALALAAVGLAPALLVIAYYGVSLGFGPVSLAWTAFLAVAGGHVSPIALIEWSLVLGVTASVLASGWRRWRVAARESEVPAPVSIRGPVTYAGPGSLGGTESALRR